MEQGAVKKPRYTILPPDTEKKVLGIFTKDRSFYHSFYPLLCIISLQQLAALAVNLVDNIMLGRYTEMALSGATLVNQIQFILQQIAAGMGMGIVVLASQYWGQRRIEPIKKIISLGVKFAIILGLIFFTVSALIPHSLLSLLTNDAAVVDEGVRYLKIICWTYLIFTVSNSLMYALQSVETVIIGTVMSISTVIINMCLNYVFIYGHFGAPELGIRGAAIATLVSRSVEMIIILVYVLKIDKKLRMKVRDLLQMDFYYLKDYIKVVTPLFLSGILWGVAQAAQTAVLGHIDASVIAANSISNVVFHLFAVFGMASANAGSVVMGKTVGSGRLEKIKPYAKTMQGLFLIHGLIAGAIIFIFRGPVMSLYLVSDETRALTIDFLTVLSVTSIGSCFQYPIASGIIAGGGNTKYPVMVENLFMWCFTIPSAAISAFVFKFPPVVTFCCLKSDQILKIIPNTIVCNRYRWVRILTRDDEKAPEVPEAPSDPQPYSDPEIH